VKALTLLTLVLSLVLASPPSHAQSGAKMPRIGMLTSAFDPHAGFEGFRQGLRDLGYVEGQSIALEARFAEGKVERLPALAAELLSLKVDVILATGVLAARAAQHATTTIPIVFGGSDPVGQGLVASLARPGGNTTGLSFNDPALMGKRLEMLKAAVPGATRVAVLWHPDFSPHVESLHGLKSAAQALGVELHPVAFRHPSDFEAGFAAMRQGGADALLVMGHPMTFNAAPHLAELAVRGRLPAIALYREFAQAGGLMAYGASIAHLYRRAASYVDKILKGAKPADLPVEQPMKFELIINLKVAQALGITIPPSLLVLADEVFQ